MRCCFPLRGSTDGTANRGGLRFHPVLPRNHRRERPSVSVHLTHIGLKEANLLHDRLDALFILGGQSLHRFVHPICGDDAQQLESGLKT
jgi:hypothetical protein